MAAEPIQKKFMIDNIYVSLDEAREEIKKRWNDVELRKKIEDELGNKFLPQFSKNPRAALTKQVCVADNGFVFFYYCAKYINAEPLAWEDYNDKFISLNEEKKGLGRLRVVLEDGTPAMVDIMDFHGNEKKKLGECVLKTGEKLVDFHHNLFKIFRYKIEMFDNEEWAKNIANADEYYYFMLLHFVAHGILFDVFQMEEDEGENRFTSEVVLPAIQKVQDKFGLKPLIFRMYPKNQTEEEDFFWWCYPPSVNERIVNYARKNSLAIKKANINTKIDK
ncbi:MAG: hypothetical protein AB1325_14435 [Nitrospirota bacterium]